jgi:UDP-glucose 4-epimerase
MRVLITGGSGFIGSHIVEYHLAKDDEVYVVDDLSTGSLENISPFRKNPHFTFEQADILDWPNIEKVVHWAERIYHMAAVVGVFRVLSTPIEVIDTNITGYLRLLKTASTSPSAPRIIVASSSSVYGHSPKKKLTEEDALIVASPTHLLGNYAISKISDEALSLAYFQEKNTAITSVRLFNTIGPHQTGRYGMVVPRFIQQACNNEPITVFGDGTQTRSFCDVRDVVIGLAMLAENKNTIGEIINVGNDKEISINELATIVCKQADSQSDIHYKSYQEAYGKNFVDIKNRRPDLTKFLHYTSYKHQWSLEDTIVDLVSRYKQK